MSPEFPEFREFREIQPAYDELVRLLNEERIVFIPDALKGALYSEVPGFAGAMSGQIWTLIAAPVLSLTLQSVRFFVKRNNTLRNSPWSYLYKAETEFGTEQI